MKTAFFDKTGKMAIGSRLRLLTARVTEEAAEVYQLYGASFVPKWFPVFYVLSQEGEGAGADTDPGAHADAHANAKVNAEAGAGTGAASKSISEIAQEIGHSQPSVSKIVMEMTAAGLVEGGGAGAGADKRRTLVRLTEKGFALARQVQHSWGDVDAAVQSLLDEATHNLWEALQEWETLLENKSLLQRVKEQKKRRESREVRIVPYEPRFQAVFKALNVEWISAWFEMEPADFKALDDPQGSILDKGGKILVALLGEEPVGVCALIKMDDPLYDYELAKMAVAPAAKGRNIGWLLGQAAVQAAREAGASRLYLESNTCLKPAINLYHKLGFQKVTGRVTPYKRANIQMALEVGS